MDTLAATLVIGISLVILVTLFAIVEGHLPHAGARAYGGFPSRRMSHTLDSPGPTAHSLGGRTR
jgi:hypothetical protein